MLGEGVLFLWLVRVIGQNRSFRAGTQFSYSLPLEKVFSICCASVKIEAGSAPVLSCIKCCYRFSAHQQTCLHVSPIDASLPGHMTSTPVRNIMLQTGGHGK